jgi:hypothetical protein
LYQGVSVFGSFPPVTVVVGVVEEVEVDTVVVEVVEDVEAVVEVDDSGAVVEVDDSGAVVEVDDPGAVVEVDDPGAVVVEVVEDSGLVVVVVAAAAQMPFVMVLVSSVTAPLRAKSCPCTVAPVFAVIDVKAKMCPTKWEFVPRVAELPTFQKVRQYRAPLMRFTLLFDAVMSVDAVWNTKTALGSPWASRVRVPVIWKVPSAESYTPALKVVPPSSVGMVVTGVLPAASL